uniref:Aminotransferase class I/classII large domain-containing protein n=1 Tax=Nelumbo nucifera TaxID=4432 RepID=A0A822XTE8_NELNU|nr:TPA_asm: hypothetical protein HUJ06_023558 [Nelumbo nucifera]
MMLTDKGCSLTLKDTLKLVLIPCYDLSSSGSESQHSCWWWLNSSIGILSGSGECVADVLETEDFDRSRVHIIYGLSKDLCLPGFRVGVIYTYNENVLAAAKRLAGFSSISTPTQRL